MRKKVSVVIPSYNEVKSIRDCIESLLKNEYPYELIEILIVDGISEDGTIKIVEEICRNRPNVHLIMNKARITPVALNMGIKNASGDYIMIASAHSQYPSDYIPKLVDHLNNSDAAVVGGVMVTRVNEENNKSVAIARVLSSRFGVGNSHFRVGTEEPKSVDTVPFGMYRRKVFQIAGYYNEMLIRNHDIELSKRIIKKGLKIYLFPDPVCYYYARENYRDLAKNNFQNGLWNILTVYITKSTSSLSIRHFVPLVFLLSLLVPLIIGIITFPPVLALSMAFLFLYCLFLLVNSLNVINRPALFFNVIWSYIVIHFSYGTGSLIGSLRIKYLLKGN